MSLRTAIWSAATALPLVLSCKAYDPLYCDAEKRCTDPDRPFCDLNGDYPASDGVGHTCIPEPDVVDADAAPGAGADGGTDDGGGTGPDASGERRVVELETSLTHTCALLSDGNVRCWGLALGLGPVSDENIGDNEHPYQAGDVPTGGGVKQVSVGDSFSCALYESGAVRCWGANSSGQLGYGHEDPIDGPDQMLEVSLNGAAKQIASGQRHTCALLESGDVRCWGDNTFYQLATGDQENIGDDEVPGSRSPVPIGGVVTEISTGREHSCAILEGGFVRCWGSYFGGTGPLGQGGDGPIGDDETPAAAGNINVGGSVSLVAPGALHSCALRAKGRVHCWGQGDFLGYQESEDIGDDETPASVGDVTIGGPALKISAGVNSRCALLEAGNVRCWGSGRDLGGFPTGFLGYGNNEVIGDNEYPALAGDVDLGGLAADLSRGNAGEHVCALMQDGVVRCWGKNASGQLGLGHTDTIGDTETPAAADPVRVLE
jgi:alpha-tubulin suppressor-like RCC1 family protein